MSPVPGPKKDKKRKNRDKPGHFWTIWETPPCRIHPPFSSPQTKLRGGYCAPLEPELSEDAMGGWKKSGGWKTSRMTPLPKRGFGPPSYGTFSTPLTCQCSVFPVQKSTTEQTRSSFGGVQKFSGERVLWYVFHPPYVLHPPISRPKTGGRILGNDFRVEKGFS